MDLNSSRMMLEEQAARVRQQIDEIQAMCITWDDEPLFRLDELRRELNARRAEFSSRIAALEAHKRELERRLEPQ